MKLTLLSPPLLFLLLLSSGTTLRAAGDNPTAYTALRLVGRELGADSLGRIVAVGGREGVPQPFVWRITLGAKPGGGGGARELEVAGGRIAANRPARGVAPDAMTIDLKNLNLDSSGAFTTADAESRRLHLPFSALNYELRADPTAGNRPAWTVQLLDGDHRPLGALLLAATDGTQIRATGRLAGGGGGGGSGQPNPAAAVVASTSTESPPPPAAGGRIYSPSSRRRTTTTTTTTTTRRPDPTEPPPVAGNEPERDGGFLERAGRTLDSTPGRVGGGVRRAGANVGVTIQRFFDPDARRE